MKGKLLDKPLFYVYKIIFSDDSTYIGCHIQWKTKDDYISQLQRLKQLLDAGVITQQEFDEKKKALLK